jgi:hypothetical protein
VVLLALGVAIAGASGAAPAAGRLYGIAPVTKCLQGAGAAVTYGGNGTLIVQGRSGLGFASFFTSAAGAQALSTERRKGLSGPPSVWTFGNVSLFRLVGTDVYQLVAGCLGKRQEVAASDIFRNPPPLQRTPIIKVGIPAKILTSLDVSGWRTVATRSGVRMLKFFARVPATSFRGFAVELQSQGGAIVTSFVGGLACGAKGGEGIVSYVGPTPAILELPASGCTHNFPPLVAVVVHLDRGAKLTARVLMH